jgi:hypothetical protein
LQGRIKAAKLPGDMAFLGVFGVIFGGRQLRPAVNAGVLAGFALAACAGFSCGSSEAKSADNERSREIVHEPCDVDAGSAVKTDVNNDGKPDIIKVMSGGKEVCRAIDLNFDGVKDAFIYYDETGAERRRESDFDRDGRPDEISVMEHGVVVRKELETNFDAKLDTWEEYQGGRLAKTERDSDGDGVIDEWWEFNRPDQPTCAVVVSDRNADGQPDPNTAVDMCGEGYKAPTEPKADASASAAATATGTAPGAFGTSGPPPMVPLSASAAAVLSAAGSASSGAQKAPGSASPSTSASAKK